MMRPRPARWFEALCPRADSTRVVAALATTGTVEVEVRKIHAGELRLRELSEGLSAFRALLPRYGRYWKSWRLSASGGGAPPRDQLSNALSRIDQWRAEADPLIQRLQTLEEEYNRIQLCEQIMRALGDSRLDFSLVNGMGPLLDRVSAVLPEPCPDVVPTGDVLFREATLPQGRYLLAVGTKADVQPLRERIKAVGGRLIDPPPWLRGRATDAKRQVQRQIIKLSAEIRGLYQQLENLGRANALPEVLGDLTQLEWFADQVGVLELASERFAVVSGWTSEPRRETLTQALERSECPALIHFPPPPPGMTPPQLLDNPPWARPFELFARAMGVPGGSEADPSPLLAVVVPLLFGYMFGDLGQGLVLFLAGWWLRGRFALAGLLMAGGASAMFFGLVFGSVFSVEHLFPPLWLHPLEHPVTVLAAPLVFAVVLLGVGQLLNGLEAAWRGELKPWLLTDAGFLLLYLGSALALTLPDLYWLPLLGLAWYLTGSAVNGGPLHALAAAGELLERGLQLLVNTLSFARVGAFALAHAGLSSALMALADAAGSAWGAALVLVVGNLVIIVLEGLVVSIQTTRLVLFEFFTRFLRGEGRVFHPLPPPPSFVQGDQR